VGPSRQIAQHKTCESHTCVVCQWRSTSYVAQNVSRGESHAFSDVMPVIEEVEVRQRDGFWETCCTARCNRHDSVIGPYVRCTRTHALN